MVAYNSIFKQFLKILSPKILPKGILRCDAYNIYSFCHIHNSSTKLVSNRTWVAAEERSGNLRTRVMACYWAYIILWDRKPVPEKFPLTFTDWLFWTSQWRVSTHFLQGKPTQTFLQEGFKISVKIKNLKPWPGGSVNYSAIPCPKRLRVRCPVWALKGDNQSMFLSLSALLSPPNK